MTSLAEAAADAPPPPPPPPPPDTSRGPGINVIAWVGFSISFAFVVARLFTRFRVMKTPGWDDYIIAFSTVLNLVFCALSSAAVSAGLGRHVLYVTPAAQSRVLYYASILQPIGIAAYCVPKLAVVILLVKLMGPRRQGVWFLYAIIAVLFISSGLSIIFIFAQCDPPSHFWMPMEPAKCLSPLVLQRITLFAGSWSAFVDLVLALFPITIFWDLQMAWQRKVAISSIMGLGILAAVCAIIKTVNLPKEQDPDFTYAFFDLLIWTFIEADVVLICACAPILPRLYTYGRSRSRKETSQKYSGLTSIGRGRLWLAGGMRSRVGRGAESHKAFDPMRDTLTTHVEGLPEPDGHDHELRNVEQSSKKTSWSGNDLHEVQEDASDLRSGRPE